MPSFEWKLAACATILAGIVAVCVLHCNKQPKVQPDPDHFRAFVPAVPATTPSTTPSTTAQPWLRVVTYNVLGDGRRYALSDKHMAYCPKERLVWDVRGPRLASEIASYGADVVGLQETQTFTLPTFAGIEGMSAFQRGQPNPLLHNKTETLLVRGGDFHIVDLQDVSFRDAHDVVAELAPADDEIIELVMSRLDGGMIAVLEHRTTGQQVVVVNVHLYWNPIRPHLKSLQAFLLLTAIHKFVDARGLQGAPVVVLGDFNSLPDSGVYQLLTTGHLGTDHPHHPVAFGHKTCGEMASPLPPLSSIHTPEPPLTTKVPTFHGTIDYVFVSPGCRVLTTLAMPYSSADGSDIGPLPDPTGVFPSDHLAVGADIALPPPPTPQ